MHRRTLFLLLGMTAALPSTLDGQDGALPADPHRAIAERVLRGTILVDGHNDLPWAIRESPAAPGDLDAPEHDLRRRTPFHTDLARLREGRVGAVFWSVYTPYESVSEGAARTVLEQIDLTRRMIGRYPEALEPAVDAADIRRIVASGRIASLLGMEGGHGIENSLGALRAYHALGVRYMTLTHNHSVDWADAASGARRHGGLSPFGREVVREMNRLGMLVDLSHASVETMSDALDTSEAPVLWSHAAAGAVLPHRRNVPDEILRRVPANGGVVMVLFYPPHLTGDRRAGIADVAEHLEHIARVAGSDHVGIGSDFDGIGTTAEGLEDVSAFPALFTELSRRGWSEGALRKLAGENLLRVMEEAEAVAERLVRERAPSTATIERLDGRGP